MSTSSTYFKSQTAGVQNGLMEWAIYFNARQCVLPMDGYSLGSRAENSIPITVLLSQIFVGTCMIDSNLFINSEALKAESNGYCLTKCFV